MEYINYDSIYNADIISSGKLVIFENIQLLILTHKNIGEFTVHADTSVGYPKHVSMSIQLSQEKRSSCITGLYPIHWYAATVVHLCCPNVLSRAVSTELQMTILNEENGFDRYSGTWLILMLDIACR